jgi:hypothetical protein
VVTRLLFVALFAWAATTAPVAAEPAPASGPSSSPGPKPDQPNAATARDGAREQWSRDDELINNLDLIENLDLLDTVEVLGAVTTPDTPEEEF